MSNVARSACLAVIAVQVLSNSYAFAYFFFGNELYSDEFDEGQNKVNQNLFEDSQEMLSIEVSRWQRDEAHHCSA